MQQIKTLSTLSQPPQLPCIQPKHEPNSCEPKLQLKPWHSSKNNHKQQLSLICRSQRMQGQYFKLCKKIKLAYGILSRQDQHQIKYVHQNNHHNHHKNYNNQPVQFKMSSLEKDKMTIKQLNNEQKINKILIKKIIQPSEFQFVYNLENQISPKIQQLQISGRNIKQPIYSNNGKLYCKNLKIMANFIVQRLQTDYLNIQKIKIQPKYRNNSQPKYSFKDLFRNQFFLGIKKKLQTHTDHIQTDDIVMDGNPIFQSKILPIIKSLSNCTPQNNKIKINKSNLKINDDKGKYKHGISNLISYGGPKSCQSVTVRKGKSHPRPLHKTKSFTPNFPTYYYRDFLWKVNFSNQILVEPPLQYQHRLRVYIGKGNNSGLIRGLLKRRIWFAVTQKIQDANFVWIQIKNISFYNLQLCNKPKDDKQLKKQQQNTIQSNQPQLLQTGILTSMESLSFQNYFKSNRNIQQRTDQRFVNRNKYFMYSLNQQIKNRKLEQRTIQQKLFNPEISPKKQSLLLTSKKNFNLTQQSPRQSPPQSPPQKKPHTKAIIKKILQIKQQKMQNHLINNYVIGNKKALLKTMTIYYKKLDDFVFNHLPHTFHIQKGIEDQNYFKFLRHYTQRTKQLKSNGTQQNVWIVKPGEFSNRGNGIKVCKTLQQIKTIIKTKQKNYDGTDRTYIVQSYIEKPLLYNKRKFDIRHYMMITCINGILKGYWYRQGYVRTTSSQYTLSTKDGSVHLTNDAVQKQLPQYGKYQKGNKISYQQLQTYITKLYGYKNYNFTQLILPKMKQTTKDIITACSGLIDPDFHSNNFQIFGLDFMIDLDFNLWLIQVNTNPCLELSCPLLAKIIPKMIQNALQYTLSIPRITIDSTYPPPIRYNPKGTHYTKNMEQQNKFDLIYDSRINNIFKSNQQCIDTRWLHQQQQTYQDQGEEWNQDD